MNGFGKTHRTSTKKIVMISAAIAVFLVAVAAAVFFFIQYNQIKSNPDSVNQEKTALLIDKIGKIYDLPDETPTVAEINNKDKLKDQAFFDKAANGDKLLIFPNAKIAMIYRESENKLINVGPISLASDQKADANSTDQQK